MRYCYFYLSKISEYFFSWPKVRLCLYSRVFVFFWSLSVHAAVPTDVPEVLNWHLMKPISALPGHVLQLPHRRRPVGQSAARALSSHCVWRWSKTTTASSRNAVKSCQFLSPRPSDMCDKHTAGSSIHHTSRQTPTESVFSCASIQLLFPLCRPKHAVACQLSAVRLTSIFSSD